MHEILMALQAAKTPVVIFTCGGEFFQGTIYGLSRDVLTLTHNSNGNQITNYVDVDGIEVVQTTAPVPPA